MKPLHALIGLAAALTMATLAPAAHAQVSDAFPTKPVRLIVPFAAGGPADIVAREMAQSLGKELGQTVVVENLGGGAGAPALAAVTRAPADGHTVLFAASGNVTIQPHLSKPPVDILKLLDPVGKVTTSPHVLVVSSKLPIRTVPELIAYAKAHPGKLNFASAGVGGLAHLAAELFQHAAGIDSRHIPYRGSSQAIADLASGEVHAMFSSQPSMKALIDKGVIRVIGLTAPSSSPAYQGIPVISRSGVPALEYATWYGIFAPAGTPAAVVGRFNAALQKLTTDQTFIDRLQAQGVELDVSSPKALADLTRSESEQWAKVIRDAKIELN